MTPWRGWSWAEAGPALCPGPVLSGWEVCAELGCPSPQCWSPGPLLHEHQGMDSPSYLLPKSSPKCFPRVPGGRRVPEIENGRLLRSAGPGQGPEPRRAWPGAGRRPQPLSPGGWGWGCREPRQERAGGGAGRRHGFPVSQGTAAVATEGEEVGAGPGPLQPCQRSPNKRSDPGGRPLNTAGPGTAMAAPAAAAYLWLITQLRAIFMRVSCHGSIFG